MKGVKDGVLLESSGRTLSAWPDGVYDLERVCYGYDGVVAMQNTTDGFTNHYALTAEEKQEIALMLITQLKEWAGLP